MMAIQSARRLDLWVRDIVQCQLSRRGQHDSEGSPCDMATYRYQPTNQLARLLPSLSSANVCEGLVGWRHGWGALQASGVLPGG
jgi:hypothetical protein